MATIEILNVDRLMTKLDKIANVKVVEAMNKAVTLVQGQAKNLCVVDTGALRSSIHTQVKSSKSEVIGRVYTSMNYAPYIEFGTGNKGRGTYPYKTKVNLHYKGEPWVYTPDGGETFYRTEGQVAKPFMYPALKMNEKTVKELLRNGTKESINKAIGG